MSIYNLVSLVGIFLLMGFAWLLSTNKKNLNLKVIIWGVGIQVLLALFIFVIPIGMKFFIFVNTAAVKVLASASAGARFVFGRLALGPGQVSASGGTSLGYILAFQAFPTIIFFSALISVLYFTGIMQKIVKGFAFIFTKLMKISGAESLVAASNLFVGVESALTVKPYLERMTRSEFCTVLTAGMATIASSVLALYVLSLRNIFPTIAGHLISASLLSIPAAIIMSKIIMPEDDKPETLDLHPEPHYEKEGSLFEAIIGGAQAGVKMIIGIVALLIAILGLVALVDQALLLVGGKINSLFGISFDWSLRGFLSIIFYPFTVVLGVPLEDAGIISRIIGERTIVTEVVAYKDLASVLARNMLTSPRSAVIATYALCGFAHIASMAIFVGGISALAPKKTRVIASVAFRALLAATLACLMTAAIAGVFFTKSTILLGGKLL